jgi:hypothetical protein
MSCIPEEQYGVVVTGDEHRTGADKSTGSTSGTGAAGGTSATAGAQAQGKRPVFYSPSAGLP